jgi:hypothetical protein
MGTEDRGRPRHSASTRCSGRLAAATAFAGLTVVGAARSAPPPYTVSYAAPGGCPSEADFLKSVASQVPDPSVAAGARLDVQIEAQEGGRYVGRITVTDAQGATGSRTVDDKTCHDVARAAAFIASMAINLGGQMESPDPKPARRPAAPRPPPAAAAPSPPPPEPTAVRVSLDAAFELVGGIAPSMRPGGRVGFLLGSRSPHLLSPWGRFSVALTESRLDARSAGAEIWLLTGRADLCPIRIGASALFASPCAGVEAGAIFSEGNRVVPVRSAVTLWLAPSAMIHARWNATRVLFLEIEGGAIFPVIRHRFFAQPDTTLYRIPPVAARLGVGLGVHF